MARQTLRDYQEDGLQRILNAYRQGARSVLAVAPTGSGKTSLFTALTEQLSNQGKPVLINVHRRELATQAATRLKEFGVPFGYIMAGEERRPGARVQIASVQSLVRRKAPPASLVINDEAHLSTAGTWQTILGNYPSARILGVTATPWRLSGKPLVGAYDAVVVISTPSALREQGHLCPYTGFSYKTPDLSGVKTTAGDYNEHQSAAAMSDSLIVDNIVEQWLAHASTLSTVVFAVTVEHSKQLAARFKAAGVAAEHLDGQTSKGERDAILARVAAGGTRVLCNVGVAVEGLDIPRLKCCVLARPTKSLARAIQMMGRVRRPWEGVTARIHDHAFVIKSHGLPDAERDYSLNAKPENPPSLTQCEECLALYEGSRCPNCAHENAPVIAGPRELNTIADAEKIEFDSGTEMGRPPVEIKWTDVGRSIEGVFEKTWDAPTHYGKQRFYLVKGEKRSYTMPGTTQLSAKMARVKAGDRIRVTFTGETDLGGTRSRKEFNVEVDDGAPTHCTGPECTRPVDAKGLCKVHYEQARAGKPLRVIGAHKGRACLNPQRQDIQAAARLHASGKKLEDIAAILDVTVSTVHRWGKVAGFGRSMTQVTMPNAHPKEIREAAARLAAEGKTLAEIGRALRVDPSTVGWWLKPVGSRYA